MEHLRITAALMNPTFQLGKDLYTSEFRNKLDDFQDFLRSRVLLPVNSRVQAKWAVRVIETPSAEYFVDIFVDDENQAEIIARTMLERVPEMSLRFFQKKFMDYLN